MGTSLSGLTPATTFDGLLKTSDNDALDATLKTIGTGDGTDSVLQLSNSALHIGGSATNETTDTWVEGFNSNLRLSANSPSMQFKDTSGTAGFMIGVSGASTFFSQSTNADFTAVSYVGKITGGKWNFGSSDTPTATVSVKGSGASAGTTSLLVQNSSGSELFKVQDDGRVDFASLFAIGTNIYGTNSSYRINIASSNEYQTYDSHIFKTYDGAAYSESMRIVGNGASPKVGIGETNPTARLQVKGSGNDATTTALLVQNSDGTELMALQDDGATRINLNNRLKLVNNAGSTRVTFDGEGNLGIRQGTPSARLHIRGAGLTSATTSLLVTDSAGTDLLKVADDGKINVRSELFVNHPSVSSRYLSLSWGAISATSTNDELSLYGGGGVNGSIMYLNASAKSAAPQAIGMKTTGVLIAPSMVQSSFAPSAQLQIKGTGATSATTALLVQNSAGTELFKVLDGGADKQVRMNSAQIGSISVVGTRVEVGTGVKTIFKSSGMAVNEDYAAADSSAQLDVSSTTKGFLPPRMTTTERDAISTPAAGLMVYNTTTNKAQCYNGTAWQDLF